VVRFKVFEIAKAGVAVTMFQFQSGAIQSINTELADTIAIWGFNSKVVRFKGNKKSPS